MAVSKNKKIYNVDEYYYVFSRVIQQKLMLIGVEPKKAAIQMFPNYMGLKESSINQLMVTNALIYGNILKKSKYLGNWQNRFLAVTPSMLVSSKKSSDKPSMGIQCQ